MLSLFHSLNLHSLSPVHAFDISDYYRRWFSFLQRSDQFPEMACMRLGSKSDSLRRVGQTWQLCSSGLASDVTIEIEDVAFQLHKFPLISRSGFFEKNIGGDSTTETGSNNSCVLKLDDIPGGAKAFEIVAKFCYGIKLELTASNVVSLRCIAEHLQMTEDYGEGNLVSRTESFLSHVFTSWDDSMKALETCEEVLPQAEEANIVSRCISSLAMKACAAESTNLFSWPISSQEGSDIAQNSSSPKASMVVTNNDWWYEDVSFLSLLLYKRFIKSVESRGMSPERVAGSLMFYAKRFLPSMNRQSSFKESTSSAASSAAAAPTLPEPEQRNLLEEIEGMLPAQKGVTQTKFLLQLLRCAMILQASPSCRDNLEKRVGAQLDQANLVDLLVPNVGYAADQTMYDVDCLQRIVDHFMTSSQLVMGASNGCSPQPQAQVDGEEVVLGQQMGDGVGGSMSSLGSLTAVAELVDSYLAEVAADPNLKLPKFLTLAGSVPHYARTRSDGIYQAVDTYLKAHPWLTEPEKEQICRLMNCQKLSLDGSTHAAQNERLPLRVVVQVLFFEQLRLRTQISGWLFLSDNHNQGGSLLRNQGQGGDVTDDVRGRVTDLEKECQCMKQDIKKLASSRRKWSIFSRMFYRRKKHQPADSKPGFQEPMLATPTALKQEDLGNGKVA